MSFRQLAQGSLPRMVMFDLDGTLVDSVPDLAFAVDALLQEHGAAIAGEARVRTWVGNGAAKLVERALTYADLETSDKAIAVSVERFKDHYRNHCAVDTVLYPGVLDCLTELEQQGVLMAIVTNKPAEFVPDILKSLSIDRFFTMIIGGDDLPQKKPSPEPLLYCLQQNGLSIEQAIMVGDSRSDIVAARAAGIPVVAVDYGYNHGKPIEDEFPDRVVSSLSDLL